MISNAMSTLRKAVTGCPPKRIREPDESQYVPAWWTLRGWLFVGVGWCVLLFSCPANGAERFPGEHWEIAATPEEAGWSSAALQNARSYAESIKSAAFLVVHQGRIVDQWGETERPLDCNSMRKSILSALYGIHVAEGNIDLDQTLDKLGIDDNEPSLTEVERGATVRDLLRARSGIYHPASYETAHMKAIRPARGSHAPGEFWYYNNWDFNALGTIFENVTTRSVFEEFEDRLAGPLQMQDFDRSAHTRYIFGRNSVHRAYPFQLSARDLARFGLLFARSGRWHDQQILTPEWIAESTRAYSETAIRGGYGYMWWVAQAGKHYPGFEAPEGTFSAHGAGGHYLLIVPQWDLVIVHRVMTRPVSREEQGRLLNLIVSARPAE